MTVDNVRDGRVLRHGLGQHRIAIARVLDIGAIPVDVLRRYRAWQRMRDRLRAGEGSPVGVDHPDLAGLRSDGNARPL